MIRRAADVLPQLDDTVLAAPTGKNDPDFLLR